MSGRLPTRPTFGFTLCGGHGFGPPGFVTKVTPWHLRFAFDIFHTAESAWDERFVSHSTRVRTLAVDADDVGTTDFNLSAEKQQLLVSNGRAAGESVPRLVLARAVREHVPRRARAEPGSGGVATTGAASRA